MSSRWNPRITRPSAGGGGPPPQIQDHFAPKIIVGNVPNGDPAVAQAFPFRYIPDPGNGSGIAQALTEVAVAGQEGDVYLRPGIYDFGLVGAPLLPLVIPDSTSLRGPGVGVPISVGGNPNAGALLRVSGTQRSLFVFGSTSSIRQLAIELPSPTLGATGAVLLDAGINGAPAFIDQTAIFVTADPAESGNESLQALVRGDFITLREVIMGAFDAPYRTGSLVGIDAVNPQCGAVQVQGLDLGIRSQGGSFENISIFGHVRGMEMIGDGFGTRISDMTMNAEQAGVVFIPPFSGPVTVTNAQIYGGAPLGVGIDIQAPGTRLILSNSNIGNWQTGIRILQSNSCQLSNVGIDASFRGVDIINSIDTVITGCLVQGFGQPASIGIHAQAGSEDTTITGSRIRSWDTGVVIDAGHTTLVANNLRFNTLPYTDGTGTSEVAHNQV